MKIVIFDRIKYEVIPVTTIERKNGPCLSCDMLQYCKNNKIDVQTLAKATCIEYRTKPERIDYIFKYKQFSRINQILTNIFSK